MSKPFHEGQRQRAQIFGLAAVLVLLVLVFGTLAKGFLTFTTLTSMANQVAPLIVVSAGLTLVLIIGGIDLSVGSVLALASVLIGVLITRFELPFGVAALAGLAVGSACGCFSGAVVAFARVPSFIVTLGMLEGRSWTGVSGDVVPDAVPWRPRGRTFATSAGRGGFCKLSDRGGGRGGSGVPTAANRVWPSPGGTRNQRVCGGAGRG